MIHFTATVLKLAVFGPQEIVETAQNYHVDLVPEVDLPGHSAWIAKQLPELLGPNCTAGASWCPIDLRPVAFERTIAIVSTIFEEVDPPPPPPSFPRS